ncbi:MAG: ribonuclease III [Candidatus Pacebacteria bacterium]|nr:ribonuclease III [Candidatus Paceibacterota bacterium]
MVEYRRRTAKKDPLVLPVVWDSPKNNMNVIGLEKTINYSFNNKVLIKEALTHRSYRNENPGWEVMHNERLEFLGDAVLELTVTEELYNRFPDEDEGKLTSIRAALVNYQLLAKAGNDINLEKSVLLSRGEARDAGGRAREVITANAMEALIGALYLDGGLTAARTFVADFVMNNLHEILKTGSHRDPKSTLQEITQASKKMTPSYRIISETGPEHNKVFKVSVYFENEFIAEGEGYSKQEAEVDAAKKALEALEKRKIM